MPIPVALVEALREHRRRQNEERLAAGPAWQDHGGVFWRGDGTPLHGDYLTKHLKRTLRQAGLPNVTFHSLRHTYASVLLMHGAHPKVVADLLGHSTTRLTLQPTRMSCRLSPERRWIGWTP